MNITSVSVPGDPVVFARTSPSTTPITTPPTSARGNDTIAPKSAATSPRRSRSGPSATVMSLVRWFRTGAAITALTAATVPATIHTCVDTAFTRTPDSDAALGLSAAERTASPNLVRCRSTARITTMIGTIRSTTSCSPRTVSAPIFHTRSMAVGKARSSSTVGSCSCTSRITCAMPMVATNRSSRGCLNRRRTTSSSVMPPSTAPVAMATGNVSQKGQP